LYFTNELLTRTQRAFARLGMKIALADLPASLPALTALSSELSQISKQAGFDGAEGDVLVVPTDVTVLSDVQKLRETVYEAWSEVGVLMNNAGIGSLGGVNGAFDPLSYVKRQC
jgi:NAD(P)-dependent dehydrogenase (short-subunit alcohol dehydrogenase family)